MDMTERSKGVRSGLVGDDQTLSHRDRNQDKKSAIRFCESVFCFHSYPNSYVLQCNTASRLFLTAAANAALSSASSGTGFAVNVFVRVSKVCVATRSSATSATNGDNDDDVGATAACLSLENALFNVWDTVEPGVAPPY